MLRRREIHPVTATVLDMETQMLITGDEAGRIKG
jgi:hypothetical protein